MVTSHKFNIKTRGNGDVIDVTGTVAAQIASSGLSNGLVTIFISGSTAAVTTMEYEDGLISDFQEMWQRQVPPNASYNHNRKWGDGNGHAHVRASLLGPSLVVPFADRQMTLGSWQQIVVIDFDNRPRSREVIIQLMGE